MVKVQAFEFDGVRCLFYTGDHAPPHFHASVPDEWEIRVFFLEEPVRYDVRYELRRIPGPLLRRILEAAAAHRAALFREWEHSQPDG